jgi:hypothetical protein
MKNPSNADARGAPLAPPPATAAKPRLKEGLVKDALARLSWPDLEAHLDATGLDDDGLDDLLGHVRRADALVLKRPDDVRSALRAQFLGSLSDYLTNSGGADAAVRLDELIDGFAIVERGYHEILWARDATSAAKLLPEMRAAAALNNTVLAFEKIGEAIEARGRHPEVFLQSLRVDTAGASVNPDGILGAIVGACSGMLFMEAYLNDWYDADGTLILPELPRLDDADIRDTAEVMALAAAWRRWEHLERRWRPWRGDRHPRQRRSP